MRSLFSVGGVIRRPIGQSQVVCLSALFSDNATQVASNRFNQYNIDRAKWRDEVSVFRKQYASEEAARREEAAKRKQALATDIARRKAENMRKKLARTAETAKRVAIERAATTAAFEAHVMNMNKVRAVREAEQDSRTAAMIAYLEEQSKLWLTPERVDKEITEEFVSGGPALAGMCQERSPYWGFVAEVQDVKEMIAQVQQGLIPVLDNSRMEPMDMAHTFMLTASRNYLEYKRIRESDEGDIEGVLQVFRDREVKLEESWVDGNLAGDDEEDDESASTYPNRNLGGGMIGRFAKPNANQLDDQDEQKIAEQLARLRARRLRPVPVDSNTNA
jgi:hypothetical protein